MAQIPAVAAAPVALLLLLSRPEAAKLPSTAPGPEKCQIMSVMWSRTEVARRTTLIPPPGN